MAQDIETDHMIITIELTAAPFNKYGDSLRELGGTMTFNIKARVKTWAELAAKMAEVEKALK
jgi:hypothetical protein